MEKYDCEICNNKRFIMSRDPNDLLNVSYIECECVRKRALLHSMEKIGIGEEVLNKTFETYEAKHDWQKLIKGKAQRFAEKQQGLFYIGGQVGSGKTHICTAILNKLWGNGNESRYVVWSDIITRLKQSKYNTASEYQDNLQELKQIKVLFIDDFFKDDNPTKADIQNAFEIINARYTSNKTITLISSERTVDELKQIDEAIASRIFEMADFGEYAISVGRQQERNYRFFKNNK